MKKGIATITMCVYLLVSCGVIISFHYCMNKLDSTRLYVAESEYCGKCGMHVEDANGCCRDEVKIIKMDEDQRTHDIFPYDIASLKPHVAAVSDFMVAAFENEDRKRFTRRHPPPLLTEQDTYLLNRVFRI